jgi:AraC family transcriptional regulator
VEAYIDDNLAEEIRIADLARLVGLSEGHFHRAFRTSTGRTPLDRVNAARITRAMSILATEDVPVAELAARVGFVSPSYFSRLFRRRTGCSPGALRRR